MKMLYLSCHGILEYDELRMFSDMGFTVFSPSGCYQTPDSTFPFRPKIDNLKVDLEDLEIYNKSWYIWDYQNRAPKSFIDRFDLIYVMGLQWWIPHNWESFKHKPVIFRSIGQSNSAQELDLKNFRRDKPNLKIVRYSPTESNYENYAGEDAVIRFAKRPHEWNNWNGDTKSVVTVVQSMKRRADHCSWNWFDVLSKRIPCKLYGGDNPEVDESLFGGSPSHEELKKIYQNHRVYFYAGTKPANYTLNFMEAWMTGTPIVALSEKMIKDDNHGVYEVPNLIENGKTGFVADSIEEFEGYTKQLFDNDYMANQISYESRQSAIKLFDESNIVPKWHEFFYNL